MRAKRLDLNLCPACLVFSKDSTCAFQSCKKCTEQQVSGKNYCMLLQYLLSATQLTDAEQLCPPFGPRKWTIPSATRPSCNKVPCGICQRPNQMIHTRAVRGHICYLRKINRESFFVAKCKALPKRQFWELCFMLHYASCVFLNIFIFFRI
jgi:hypothetical protein